LPIGKDERVNYINQFKEQIKKNREIRTIRKQVNDLCKKFPVY
jgi:glycine/serine hydroxymethyltransferase